MQKTILITGGRGFIGRALVKKFLEHKYRVRVITRTFCKAHAQDGVEFVQASYSDVAALSQAVEGCSAVYHLAAAIFAHSKDGFEKANAQATANIVSASLNAKTPPEAFIYVSSLAAGGPSLSPTMPKTEADPPMPVSYYGMTKLAGERELARLPAEIKKVVIRPPIVYGRNDAGISKIGQWVARGVMINPCQGESFFSFVYLDDLVNALYAALENPATTGQTYYVCEDKIYPWKFFISAIANAMQKPAPRMITLPPAALKLAGGVYETIAAILGADPVFNTDKAREACAGNWIALPKKWETDNPGFKWTALPEGLEKTFSPEKGKA